MSADELRARFSQAAEKVVPMQDPHGRLMARHRRRLRVRIASFATLTAAIITGGLVAPTTLLGVASSPELPHSEVVNTINSPTRQEYLDRLIRAPLRGNLSGDLEMVASVQKALRDYAPAYEGATDPNLVFLNRTSQMLQAVVIYTGGGRPIAVARGSQPYGSTKDLVSNPAGFYAPVEPFLVVQLSDRFGKASSVVGLAPPGCSIEHSTKGAFAPDGTWVRVYDPEPTLDYITRAGHNVNELWRVSCDGRVREVRIADDYLDTVGVEDRAAALYERVVSFSGGSPAKGVVQWRGTLPGRKFEAVLVTPFPAPGPAMVAVGPFPKAILATDLLEKVPVPTATSNGQEWSMVALGVSGDGLSVVRLPQPFGDRTVLGDQVLVHSETGAASVQAVDFQQNALAMAVIRDGVALLSFKPGAAYEIRTVTSRGAPLKTLRFAEPAKGSRVLGDQLFKDW